MTLNLCRGLVEANARMPTGPVAEHVRNRLLVAIATAMVKSRAEALQRVVEKASEHGGRGVAPVPGRSERLDLLAAALVTGMAADLKASNGEDPQPAFPPGAPILGATLGLAIVRGASGHELLSAFTLGCEAALRLGSSLSPSLEEAGWDATAVCGGLGAAVAAGLLLRLPPEDLAQAVGIAASSTAGNQEGYGTPLEPFQAGKAASNGLFAALLASRGFTASTRALEGPRGLFRALLPGQTVSVDVDEIGGRWMLAEGHPPFQEGGIETWLGTLIEPTFPRRSEWLLSAVADLPHAANLTELEAAIHPEPGEALR